jgi:hypothetical protein
MLIVAETKRIRLSPSARRIGYLDSMWRPFTGSLFAVLHGLSAPRSVCCRRAVPIGSRIGYLDPIWHAD